MAKFRKKPVVIEAVQYDGTRGSILETFRGPFTFINGDSQNDPYVIVQTLEDGKNGEAEHVASIGDWIIRGVKGEFYPCKPDIFAATYEPAALAEGGT